MSTDVHRSLLRQSLSLLTLRSSDLQRAQQLSYVTVETLPSLSLHRGEQIHYNTALTTSPSRQAIPSPYQRETILPSRSRMPTDVHRSLLRQSLSLLVLQPSLHQRVQ